MQGASPKAFSQFIGQALLLEHVFSTAGTAYAVAILDCHMAPA